MRRRIAFASLVVAVAAITVGACGSDPKSGARDEESAAERAAEEGGVGASELEGELRACDPPSTEATADALPLLPTGVTLPEGTTVIGIEDEATHVTVTGQLPAGDATPTSLRKRFQAELEQAGYEITGGEDEGHESEVFFAFDDGRKGTVQSVKSSCPPDTVRFLVSYLK